MCAPPHACRVEEIRDADIGTRAGLFEVLKIGDEFYSFLVDCRDPKACTILLRGASKDVLNEVCMPRGWPLQYMLHPLAQQQASSAVHPGAATSWMLQVGWPDALAPFTCKVYVAELTAAGMSACSSAGQFYLHWLLLDGMLGCMQWQ